MSRKNLPYGQRKPKRNPCSSAPKYPANVVFTSQATEALTHLRFTGKVKWDAVTEDQDGFPVKIDRYEVRYWAVFAENLLTKNQQGVETNTAGFVAGPNTTISRDTSESHSGSASLKAACSSGSYAGFYTVTDDPPATVGEEYTATVWVKGPAGKALTLNLEWLDSGHNYFGNAPGVNVTLTGSWQRVTSTGVAPATTAFGRISVYTQGDQGTFDFYTDDLAFHSELIPVESEDSKTRFRVRHKAPVSHVGIEDATAAASIATFTTAREHGFQVDDVIIVTGVTPSAYNGTWTVLTTPTSTTLTANIGSTPGDLTDKGRMDDGTDTHHIITGPLPRPKKWYWIAQARARNTENCWSPWSPWSSPHLPWAGANPSPPQVVGETLDWEKTGQKRFGRWVGVVRWTEVTDFDYPGTPADDEDDVTRYAIQVQRSTDGSTPVGTTRRYLIEAKDADADTEAHVKVRRVNERHYYRARIRCIDRFNRRGPWSNWTAWEQPGQDVMPNPTNVRIKGQQKDSVVIRWDAPIEAGETDVLSEEIEHFQVWLATGTFTGGTSWTGSAKYEVDHRTTGERKIFGIEPNDRDLVFFGRTRSMSPDGIPGPWINAVTAAPGNSATGVDPVGIQLVRDRVIATWTKNGSVVQKAYRQMWTADRRYKFVKVRARCGRHTQADHPSADGCPTGSALILQVKHHVGNEDGSDDTITNLFPSDSRIQIPASKHKDTVWAEDMNKTHIEEDERLSITVSQVGSTNPGEDLVVQVVMVPD